MQGSGGNKKRGVIIGVVTGASAVALGLLVLATKWAIRRKKAKNMERDGGGGLVAFTYRELRSATKNFSDKLGQGGFGSVFKGQLTRDATAVAVKRLDGSFQGEKQFRAEVSSIGVIQHVNLVKLIGFCCDGHSRFLVYEHLPNRSLDIHLFRTTTTTTGRSAVVLDWAARFRIAAGVARGLAYLHEGCRERIIHCDVKPQNVLLDAALLPKLADFGMAKFVGRDFSRVLTTMRGTKGYLAPEWIGGAAVTPKVDVYSYGMVLLELVSGRRNSDEGYTASDGERVVYFPMRAARELRKGDVSTLLDDRLCGDANLEEVERACKVACWCIQDDEADRPTMGEVVQMLEGLLHRDMPPLPRLLETIFGTPQSLMIP
jgi:serine/threonine protein kinase